LSPAAIIELKIHFLNSLAARFRSVPTQAYDLVLNEEEGEGREERGQKWIRGEGRGGNGTRPLGK